MIFSERLRQALKEKHITQYRLSKATKLSGSTISALVNGVSKYPNIETIEKIAHALGMTVSELTGEEKQEKPAIDERYAEVYNYAKIKKISPEKLKAIIDMALKMGEGL